MNKMISFIVEKKKTIIHNDIILNYVIKTL